MCLISVRQAVWLQSCSMWMAVDMSRCRTGSPMLVADSSGLSSIRSCRGRVASVSTTVLSSANRNPSTWAPLMTMTSLTMTSLADKYWEEVSRCIGCWINNTLLVYCAAAQRGRVRRAIVCMLFCWPLSDIISTSHGSTHCQAISDDCQIQ